MNKALHADCSSSRACGNALRMAVWVASTALFFGLSVSSVLAAPGAHGPNGEHLDAAAPVAKGGLARLSDGSVNIPKLSQRRMEIRTLMPEFSELAKTQRLNAVVEIDPNAGGVVQAPFAGQVSSGEQGFPALGQTVKKGQRLARLKPLADGLALSEQQSRLADIEARLVLAKQALTRYEQLKETTPRKELEAARLELQALQASRSALSQSLTGGQWLTAPSNGVVASASALNGQVVQSGQGLFQIVDPQRLIVQAQVSDPAVAASIENASIEGLTDVELTLQGAAGVLINGRIPVRFQAVSSGLDKPLSLVLGQPVTVIAQLRDRLKGILLPASAIVRNQNNEASVWVKSGAERFVSMPVQVEPFSASEVVVIKGLSPDNRVVVKGASLISQIR